MLQVHKDFKSLTSCASADADVPFENSASMSIGGRTSRYSPASTTTADDGSRLKDSAGMDSQKTRGAVRADSSGSKYADSVD